MILYLDVMKYSKFPLKSQLSKEKAVQNESDEITDCNLSVAGASDRPLIEQLR